jgi:hypothetical protein
MIRGLLADLHSGLETAVGSEYNVSLNESEVVLWQN